MCSHFGKKVFIRIKLLKEKSEDLSKLSENKQKFEDKSEELFKIDLFIDLQEKLNIKETYGIYNHKKLVKLIKEKKILKKNIQDLIEGLKYHLDI